MLIFFASMHAEPPKRGNLLLKESQQPSPLFSFGQTIINKGDFLLAQYLFRVRGQIPTCDDLKFMQTTSALLYGVSDKCSFAMALPVAIQFDQGPVSNTGVDDLTIQLEYALLSTDHTRGSGQITVVGQLIVPAGKPEIGFGSTAAFLGLTFSYMADQEYLFTNYGATFHSHAGDLKLGTEFFYEFGIGYNFGNPFGGILTGIFEIDGIYRRRNRLACVVQENTGNHVLYMGPTLFFSLEKVQVIAGIQIPATQHYKDGSQVHYRGGFVVAITF